MEISWSSRIRPAKFGGANSQRNFLIGGFNFNKMKRITKEGEFGISATSSPTLNNNLYHSHHHHEPTTPTHRNVVYGLVGIGNASPIDYPHRLNTFIKPPDYEISIEQFEEFAFARLQGKLVYSITNIFTPILYSLEGS